MPDLNDVTIATMYFCRQREHRNENHFVNLFFNKEKPVYFQKLESVQFTKFSDSNFLFYVNSGHIFTNRLK